jgi:transaldolase
VKIFLDSGNLEEVKKVKNLGILKGITTNPTLIAKEKIDGRKNFLNHIKNMCEISQVPVSAEIVSLELNRIIEEGEELHSIHPNVVVKIPLNEAGLQAIHYFQQKNIATNATVIFSPLQGMLAAINGANYVSPYIGRLDDIGHNGLGQTKKLITIFNNYQFKSEIIAASVKTIFQIINLSVIGVHILTLPYTLIMEMLYHPLTDIGIEKFLKDWRSVEQTNEK